VTALPTSRRRAVKVHGVNCYPLTRGQAIALQAKAKDGASEEEVERLLLTLGTDATEEEVAHYYASAPAVQVEAVVEKLLDLAGMGPDQGKGSSGA